MPAFSTAKRLVDLLASGLSRIGEISIHLDERSHAFLLCHTADKERAISPDSGGLTVHYGPDAAREIATFSEDGTFRFTKVQLNLRQGWVMLLDDEEQLRLALDHFYPSCVGLFNAWREGTLEIQPLREKLARQTGMYRFTKNISDAGAQKVIREVCGPANRCARKILWQIDANTPLEDNEASQYSGILGDSAGAIPLLCREACNHFVAECRKAAQAEAKLTEL
jgi:sirohydrochlorin cobaltochelatase